MKKRGGFWMKNDNLETKEEKDDFWRSKNGNRGGRRQK